MTDVVAALIWEGDRFLACQRPAHKARGLLWEFVKIWIFNSTTNRCCIGTNPLHKAIFRSI